MSSSQLRPATPDDADAIAALYVRTFGDARPTHEEEIEMWLRNAAKLENTRVLEADGEVVGYADLWFENECVGADIVSPDHAGELLDWVEQRARDAGIPKTRAYFPAAHPLEQVVAARGYSYWRSAFNMEIELSDASPVALPDGFALRAFTLDDSELLRGALNEVFREGAFFHEITADEFAGSFLGARGFDPSLWLLAEADGELAGFVLGFALRGSDERCGWVWNLGVRNAWRRRGLGSALLRNVFALFRERGLERAGLGVDAENPTGAVALYERAGMRQVGRLDNWVKSL